MGSLDYDVQLRSGASTSSPARWTDRMLPDGGLNGDAGPGRA